MIDKWNVYVSKGLSCGPESNDTQYDNFDLTWILTSNWAEGSVSLDFSLEEKYDGVKFVALTSIFRKLL